MKLLAARVGAGGALLLCSMTWASAAPPPKVHLSCTANNKAFVEVHYDKQTQKLVEINRDDWHVECTKSVNGKIVEQIELPLTHPTEFRDAMEAIRVYMQEANRVPMQKGDVPKP